MNTNAVLDKLSRSQNIYGALEVIAECTDLAVNLDSFRFYKDVNDSAKLRMLAQESKTVEDFVRLLKTTDSDLARAVDLVPQGNSSNKVRDGEVREENPGTGNRRSPSRYSSLGYFMDTCRGQSDVARHEALDELAIVMNKRTTNNVIVCAPPGVGKTHLVESYASSNKCQFEVFYLDLPRVIAGTKYRGELESKMVTILTASIDEEFAIFVDEIHTLALTKSAEGGVNLLDILKPYLLQPSFRMIGATTPDEVDHLLADNAFARRFTFMRLEELTDEQLCGIYAEFTNGSCLEAAFGSKFWDVKARLDAALPQKNYPDKLLDYLEYAESFVETLGIYKHEPEAAISITMDRYLKNRFT
ncbi:AAA family ATPase [Pseudarthrobacter sp. NamE5]|uniref:AAA family ATPase n=1 Tax=Pseudarthrobacter sp. NamE5 TaxID=2576839 RepID=UPI00110A8856|nr:AAA family ATPase [Pseudarthrobacter sp. NamE5]TLM80935.1 ATP-dependent Clp protease ATP-binding subunit [Pseudarthrobacter sp. NamE5]